MNVQTPTLMPDEQTGYPLITFPEIPFQIGFLPLTWVQLEYLLAETKDRRFDTVWYQRLVQDTGRTSSATITRDSVDSLFVRGLTLQEVQMIGRWWGADRFFVPTADEWQRVSDAAVRLAPLDWRTATRSPRARTTLDRLDAIVNQPDARTLADQMLLRSDLREMAMQSEGSTAVVGITTVPKNTLDRDIIKRIDEGNRTRRPFAMRLFLRLSNHHTL